MEIPFDWSIVRCLQKVGVVSVQEGDFGELRAAVNTSSLYPSSVVTLAQPVTLFVMEPYDEFTRAAKLDLLLQLRRCGWEGRAVLTDPLVLDGPLLFSYSMILRSKMYWIALLEHHSIFKKGADKILHNQVESYYMCLLRMSNLQGFHDKEGFTNFTTKHFQAILDGNEVPVASANAVVFAAEDMPEGTPMCINAPLPHNITDLA